MNTQMNTTDAESNWTPTPPTEPGQYYWKRCIDSPAWFVRDLIDMGRLGLGDHGELLESIGGLWGGRVPAPGTTWNVEEIEEYVKGNLIFSVADGKEDSTHFKQYNQAVRHIWGELADKEDGLAAVTERHRKEQG